MLPDSRRIRSEQMLNALLIAPVAVLAVVVTGFAVSWWWCIPIVLLACVIWRWSWRRWRRRRLVAARPLPAQWAELLKQDISFISHLDESAFTRFGQMLQIFLDETLIIAVGCELTERDRLLIAASAIIPVFGFPFWEYAELRRVIVRPHAFATDFDEGPAAEREAAGMVGGLGLMHGVVVLALDELRDGFAADDADNVGIHEFAHLIDQALGGINGVPAGLTRTSYQPWLAHMQEELAKGPRPSAVLKPYGYTNEQEFFAVASEHFFERPDELRRRDPRLYALLRGIFRQDLLARASRQWRRLGS